MSYHTYHIGTPYQSSLDHDQFRVVQVEAGRWHDPLRCELGLCKLDDASEKKQYKALSYVWGSPRVTETISLGGRPFEITLNLSCALRHLRRVDQDIFLWVDALCINQRDPHERNLQVGIMHLIYKSAEEVVVFMGDGRSHRLSRSQVMEKPLSTKITLRGYESDQSFLTEILRTCQSSRTKRLMSSLTAATCAMCLVSLFSDHKYVEKGCKELMKLDERTRYFLFECLRAFVTSPWWSRIWVVQEIAVGNAVTIQYGTTTLSWQVLVATADVWSSPGTRQVATSTRIEPDNLKVFTLFANQLNGLEQARRKWHAEGGTDLVRLLQEFSNRHASDDRDKVYGLLSLAKQYQQYIKPDYELDVFGTYRATALALIGEGGSLACWAGDQKRKFNKGLPSWIPDWSTAVETGDKRRLDLFNSYAVNRGWTLRIVDGERDYWYSVDHQMELLMNSPAVKSRRLPASLYVFVNDYIEALIQRDESLQPFRINADELEKSGLDSSFTWDLQNKITPSSTIDCLNWCDQHQIFPRSGVKLLMRWIRDLTKARIVRTTDNFSGYVNNFSGDYTDNFSEHVEPFSENTEGFSKTEPPDHEKIRQSLQKLGDAMVDEDLEMGKQSAKCAIYDIESIILGPEIILGTEISLAVEGVLGRCRQLSALCKASDNDMDPSTLFQMSYSLRGTASWLTEYQVARTKPNLKNWGLGLSPCKNPMTTERVLGIQTVVVDTVTFCGPRQFGWSDTGSALNTLISWLCHSNPFDVGERVQLDYARIRQFARTIIGGMYRSNTSYQKANDGMLGPLEDWLRQSFIATTEELPWKYPDKDGNKNAFIALEHWQKMRKRRQMLPMAKQTIRVERVRTSSSREVVDYALTDVPQYPEDDMEWLQKALLTIDFAAPPGPFFEDIQVATDGRVFFLTNNGSMGLGPASMQEGDTIHVLPNGSAHFMLRHKPSLDPYVPGRTAASQQCARYELIGDCYLDTNSTIDDQRANEEEPVLEGSLPFELLGSRYLENMLPRRETILLV